MQQSLTNKIIANIKQTSNNQNNFINSENVICIDSSNNRLGINTKTPQYSIDISGTNDNNKIRANSLLINNLGIISEISCNKLETTDLSINNIVDISLGLFDKLKGKTIDVQNINIDHIDITNVYIPTISCENFFFSNTISGDKIDVNYIQTLGNIDCCGIITTTGIEQEKVIAKTADISNIIAYDISSDYIVAHEISANFLYVKDEANFLENSYFNNLKVTEEASFNTINVENIATFQNITVSGEGIFSEISANIINVSTLTASGESIFKDGKLEYNQIANFTTIDASFININNSNGKFVNNGTTDISSGKLFLPLFNNESEEQDGSLRFDVSKSLLKVYNNSKWNNFISNVNYATIKLDQDISGNDISYNSNSNSYFIENSNNLIFANNYKWIPLKIATKNTDSKFDISNNKKIDISNYSSDDIFEIHANASIQFLNKYSTDVEANNYTLGMYKKSDKLNEHYIKITNSILVLDNSYNYANSSISYIGTCDQYIPGFEFYISTSKEIDFLAINSFNCTIKQL